MPLTPEQNSQRARIAALTRWAKEDGKVQAQRGQDGLLRKWAAEVDATAAAQGESLDEAQRQRRIATKQKLHMARLAQARSKKRAEAREAEDRAAGLCINANAGPVAWFCHHYGGHVTEGTELLPGAERCAACEAAKPPWEEEPSFMRGAES